MKKREYRENVGEWIQTESVTGLWIALIVQNMMLFLPATVIHSALIQSDTPTQRLWRGRDWPSPQLPASCATVSESCIPLHATCAPIKCCIFIPCIWRLKWSFNTCVITVQLKWVLHTGLYFKKKSIICTSCLMLAGGHYYHHEPAPSPPVHYYNLP